MFFFSENSILGLLKVIDRGLARRVSACYVRQEDGSSDQEDGNSDPKYPHKNMRLAGPCSPSTGEGVGKFQSQAYLSGVTANLTKTAGSRFRKGAYPKVR